MASKAAVLSKNDTYSLAFDLTSLMLPLVFLSQILSQNNGPSKSILSKEWAAA